MTSPVVRSARILFISIAVTAMSVGLCLLLLGCTSTSGESQSSKLSTVREDDSGSQSVSQIGELADTDTERIQDNTAVASGTNVDTNIDTYGVISEEDPMFYIYVNDARLAVTSSGNSSAQALLDLLAHGDVTVAASDYGNFEKVGTLPQSLPTNDERITTEAGDVILYQGNQITVYYDTNSWSLTRLGKIEGVSVAELKEILGNGSVELRLSLE